MRLGREQAAGAIEEPVPDTSIPVEAVSDCDEARQGTEPPNGSSRSAKALAQRDA